MLSGNKVMDFQLLERTLVGRSSSFSQNQNQRTILLKSCCKHHFNCCIDNALSLLWCKYKKEAWQKVGVKCKLKTVVLPCGNWGSCQTFMMELFVKIICWKWIIIRKMIYFSGIIKPLHQYLYRVMILFFFEPTLSVWYNGLMIMNWSDTQ